MARMNDQEILMDQRKTDHLLLAEKSQTSLNSVDSRFYYEPIFSPHPTNDLDISTNFLDKKLGAPLWISSMTGGTGAARHINQNLARACGEFGLGMGLGSCRPLLESDEFFEDFNLRPIIGDNGLLFANLGIAQLEELIDDNKLSKVNEMVARLSADGLIIHINPLQEWFQPEGDRYKRSSIETISEVLEKVKYKIIVKEVGQGMGPKSLESLMRLPLAAIDFGAFGGTNFSRLEILRDRVGLKKTHEGLALVGHSADEMVSFVNSNLESMKENVACKNFIISGGVKTFLDGFYLKEKIQANAIYGQAKVFLEYAQGDYEVLRSFVIEQKSGLSVAQKFLQIR